MKLTHSVQIEYLAPNNKYGKLANILREPWAVLLDSGPEYQPDHKDPYRRYDIVSGEPLVKVLHYFDHVEIVSQNTELQNAIDSSNLRNGNSSPLSLLRRVSQLILAKYSAPPYATDFQGAGEPAIVEDLPFTGGWMGYLSYDIGRLLEQLPAKAVDDLQLPLIQMGYYQWALITDHHHKTSFVYNFGLCDNRWKQLVEKITAQLDTPANLPWEKPFRCGRWQPTIHYQDYEKSFRKVKQWIKAGDCYQVNLAQRFDAHFTGDALSAYSKLAQSNNAPFSAWMNFEQQQILSLSPERFIEVNHRQVKTQPIKGTRPRSIDPKLDTMLARELKNSEKDRAENLMIVDLLRNDLSRTASVASVTTKELFGVYSFASVHHLISTIESKLDEQYDLYDLLATTLPGGSITGAPKIRAMEIIDELEPFRRHLYCGVIGYISNNGRMDTNICIRTLTVKNDRIYCWAGGGLVDDSVCESEYQETLDKVAKILPVLNPSIDARENNAND